MINSNLTVSWFPAFFNDISSFIFCALLLAIYHIYLRYKVSRDPTYTIQAINRIVRTVWVETIMSSGKPDVIPIQTFRNSTMAATFLASTSVLLIMGVLTLTAQGDKMNESWHVLNNYGAVHMGLWMFKLILMLLDLFIAFFSFSMSIRIYHHVGYMINIPVSLKQKSLTPQHVALHLNSAGSYYSIGMRAYYFIVPLVFWLFGPHFMVAATMVLIPILYKIDRAPKVISDDYR